MSLGNMINMMHHSSPSFDTDNISSSSTSEPPPKAPTSLLCRLYISHALSTWNARTFEFGAVIFLAAIFPGTLFFASCYALFRSAAAAVLGPWIGSLVDRKDRLFIVRQSILWQRWSVAGSCVVLVAMLSGNVNRRVVTHGLFFGSVMLACLEKLAFVANTVAVERDWVIVVANSLNIDRQELNSVMRRIDLICKLVAPVCVGLLDGYSTTVAIWAIFAQNAISVAIEYFAIAQVYAAIPELAAKHNNTQEPLASQQGTESVTPPSNHNNNATLWEKLVKSLHPWKAYVQNPAFLASFSLSLLYLTVLSFASQMTTYLITLGFTSTHVSMMRLASVILELSATCAAPWLMNHMGAVRSGLWFINEQLLSIALAIGLFLMYLQKPLLAGVALVSGVALSRLGLWGFDLSVQYLVQEEAPEATRGSFSAIEMSLQNFFELLSFSTTIIFYRPEDFKIPILISAGAIATSAACFAAFVRQKRGHLLHTDRCLRRMGVKAKAKYQVLPTIEEEVEADEMVSESTGLVSSR